MGKLEIYHVPGTLPEAVDAETSTCSHVHVVPFQQFLSISLIILAKPFSPFLPPTRQHPIAGNSRVPRHAARDDGCLLPGTVHRHL